MLIDIIILMIIIMGGIIGFKNGFTKQLVLFIGFFLVVILSFILKNYVSAFLFEILPFFKFGGVFKGVTVLNIALYEIIAFLITLFILLFIYRILLKITGLFEKLLNITIILGIPSKILGAIVGMVQYYVWTFIILYIISLPFFSFDFINESNYKNKILTNTPILSSYVSKSIKVLDEFEELKEQYSVIDNANEFNLEALDLFLKYNVTSVNSIDKLIKMGKLKIHNVDVVLNRYRGGI